MVPRLAGGVLTAFMCVCFSTPQCANDQRTDKKGGILIEDYTITGTQTVSATELGSITSDLTGSCFDDDSEEIGTEFAHRFRIEATSAQRSSMSPSSPAIRCAIPIR